MDVSKQRIRGSLCHDILFDYNGHYRRNNNAILRICTSCDWIFKISKDKTKIYCCPRCAYSHVSAHFVFGPKAYSYEKSQEPWYYTMLQRYEYKLKKEIKENNDLRSG